MLPSTIIMGPSGSGKSSSIRNMPPEKTIILNTERKALPFRNQKAFKGNILIRDYKHFLEMFEKALASKKIRYIVIESLTSLIEMIKEEAEMTRSGFDVWDKYNKDIAHVLKRGKSITDKYLFYIAIDQVIESPEGVAERYVAVQGNAWKKSIEKEAVVVVYATMVKGDDGELKRVFVTNKCEGYENISVKSPFDLMPLFIDNDIMVMVRNYDEFYGVEDLTDDKPSKEVDETKQEA